MKTVTIDCSPMADRNAFHDVFADALSFPDWYGRNLDALHDLLTAISEETTLQLLHWGAAENALGNYALAAKRAMTHAAGKNPNLTVEFC